MNEKRIRNMVLAIVAGLLLLNLGCMLFPGTHAVSTIQYNVIKIELHQPNGALTDASAIQRTLNQQGAQGWEYVGDLGATFLIFKK